MGRATVPMRIRVAMSIVLTLVMLASMNDTIGYIPTSIPGFVMVLILEAALGMIFGFIVNLILNVIILAGKIIDNQITIALAEVMDPTTGVTMPIMANLYYYLFTLYFFLAGGHLSYIELFARSYDIIPIGFQLTPEWINMTYDIALFLGTVFTLAVKMSMPIIASEMILQVCVGVIMKAVPSIQIFVVNIQMKILMGFIVIVAITGPMSDFIQRLMDIMFENLFGTLERLG
jgi:flagellar biosynthetic protein FliR